MESEEIINKVLFNYFVDMKKKVVNKKERAEMLANYLEKTGLSQRELAKEIGLPHSTVQDWLLLSRISNDEYVKLLADGMSDTAIYRMLRDNRDAKKGFDLLIYKQEVDKFQKKLSKIIDNKKLIDKELKKKLELLKKNIEELLQ